MPIPLLDSISDQLRDPTTALAAAFVIASRHPSILQWAARVTDAAVELEPRRRRPRKANGAAHHRDDRRRVKRDRDDANLLEAMRASPDGSIYQWAAEIGKSRSSVVTALHRLRDADLAESVGGKWRLCEPSEPREPPPKWTAPVSATSERRRGRSSMPAESVGLT